MPLKCASYAGIGERDECVRFFHGDGIFADIHAGQRVLVVDDVFDSGKTAEAVSERIASTGAQMRFACVYWKRAANTTALAPDYFVSDPGEEWIVFPHEIEGLDSRQLAEKDPELARLVKGFLVESYLADGCQEPGGSVWGQSITDPCLGWEKTERLVLELAERFEL